MMVRKEFTAFVSSLGEDEVRRELALAYEMMERCLDVLNGDDYGPVAMLDNGESSDLELFYKCREVRKELDECYGRGKVKKEEDSVQTPRACG